MKLVMMVFAKRHGKPRDEVFAARVVALYSSSHVAEDARRSHRFPG